MREFGAAPYSNMSCAVESLVSTSLAWTELHLIAFTSAAAPNYMYICFSCCSPITFASACCSPTASSSAAAAQVRLLVIMHTQYKIQ